MITKALFAGSLIMAEVSANLDLVAGSVALVTAISLFAVALYRIASLEGRVKELEASDRNHGERMVAVETKLTDIRGLLQRIAEKLNVN